ncbi:hypothetical protein O3G_MSEX001756 [Manduca sexta]|uniref:Uncharacterized protein n=1 Tax=Manduca sexta TaxID=7130 RepID=A0A922CD87_MANSE|nr:hypothetical protein O3G_MSEX001756 [Manduca sexta]
MFSLAMNILTILLNLRYLCIIKYAYSFYAAIIYIWIQTSWLAYCNTTMDAFVSFFFAQTKTQLRILRHNLENVIKVCKLESKKNKIPLELIFDSHIRKILLHYEEIIIFSNKILNIFGGALLYQFLVSGWIICTTAYRIVNIHPASMEFVSMIMYMCCILTEIFLFCFFGNEVTHESERLKESVYEMNWLEIPLKYRRTLIIFMERIKRPIDPMAGAIIPLSNSTFLSVVKSSYTFYTFLKNTEK